MEEDQSLDTDPALPRYPGEDTRPTSKREVLGWYTYGWAAEVFTVCAMGKVPELTLTGSRLTISTTQALSSQSH